MSRATSLVAREHELDRALHSLRFSGGVLITGEAGAGKTFLAARVADQLPQPPVAWLMATTASRATPLGALSGLLPPDLATIHPALVAQHVSTRLRELSHTQARPAPGATSPTRPAPAAPARRTAPPVLVVDDAQLLDPQGERRPHAAVGLLAVIVVLPEYAVDLYFAYQAGARPEYVQYAAANMTGSNRLLLGLGWASVVLVALLVASRKSGLPVRELVLPERYRLELGFLLVAAVVAFAIPISGQISLLLAVGLLGLFACYLVRVARDDGAEGHDLVGPAARIGALPRAQRRPLVIAMFAGSALAILACAAPFAEALLGSGAAIGLDEFLLVQWLAPLASEAPEFIVALLFAFRGRAALAIGILISAKVNQWTLLVGSLPVAYLFGGGSGTLVLDARQVEEVLLTATQTLMGVALLLALRFPRWAAYTLFGLFAVQFFIPGLHGRLVLSGVYAVVALVLFIRHRREILPTLTAPFRRTPQAPVPAADPDRVLVG